MRNLLYDRRIYKPLDVPCRVVSIGNITVGGTGKTPIVIMTAKHLKAAGYKVAVISRGYRRRGKEPLKVSDGETIFSTPREAGDEPHIIALSVSGVPVFVDSDRYRAAHLVCNRIKPDVIILDDGFQHRRLYRNVDVVTLDAENLYGNGCLMPRGILRESPYSLLRAKAVIITRFHEETCRRENIERMVRFYNRNVPIFWSRHVPSGLRAPGTGEKVNSDEIRGARVAAMSNIACPDSFRRMLVSLGADITVHHTMPDHHRYSEHELERIEQESRDADASIIIMTAKDERNLPESYRFKSARALVLDIEASLIEHGDEYLEIIAPGFLKKETG
jgi:tetraacyldisaccharide 4'-kinase